jgi:hypothetical protein
MTPEISEISPKPEEDFDDREEEVDSFLDNWRKIRKDSDSYTEQGIEGRHFFKKRRTGVERN